MSIDPIALGKEMLDTTKDILTDDWGNYRGVLSAQTAAIASQAVEIEKLSDEGVLNDQNAEVYRGMIRDLVNGLKWLLVGLAILTIEKIINAIMDLLKTALNTALGWTFL
ncbi:MAG: hypothetical protein KQI62_07310 [Deltaproteobacteria bacterium]|nr:hypothetical protein [Deltaproteobacteria bacterium]